MKDTAQYRPILSAGSVWDMEVLFSILDNVQNAVVVVDADAKILYINQEYTLRLGIPPEKVQGRNLRKIEPKALALQVLETKQPVYGSPEYVESLKMHTIGNTLPLYTEDGSFFGVASIFNNITELFKMTQSLERSREMADYLQEQLREIQLPQSFRDFICESKDLSRMLQLAARAALTDSTVMILGESGVGKEVIAKAIHNASKRSADPLIKLNCASIPENLLESELFGYEDGAFTGAKKGGKMGKFELANGGTIFLDEIGDMSFNMQAKLLRVLQERELERVGGNRVIKLDIRVIAATNQDLEKMIAKGTFRSDLYYRLNVISLTIPPLRERKADILPLAQHFLSRMAPDEEVTLSSPAKQILQEYHWPGNVRELENALEYANVIRADNSISIKDLPPYLKPKLPRPGGENAGRFNIKAAFAVMERDFMIEAIKASDGNKSLAIKELGLSRSAFYEKLEKYGMQDLI